MFVPKLGELSDFSVILSALIEDDIRYVQNVSLHSVTICLGGNLSHALKRNGTRKVLSTGSRGDIAGSQNLAVHSLC